jgi:hypothetical protein
MPEPVRTLIDSEWWRSLTGVTMRGLSQWGEGDGLWPR